MQDSIELTPNSLKAAAQKGTKELRELIESIPEGESDSPKTKVDRARKALELLRNTKELQELSEKDSRVIIEASRQIIQEALDAVTVELQKAAGTRLKELEKQQEDFYGAKTEALDLEANLASLAGRAGIEFRELKLDLKHASTEEKAFLAGIGIVASGVTLWVWSKIWGSKEKPGAIRRLGGLIAAAAAGIAGVLTFRKRGPGGKDSLWKKTIEKAPPAVQAPVGVLAGAGSKITERAAEQVDAASHLPAMLYEAFVNGDFQSAMDQGWIFVKKETGWIVTNGKEMFQVPLEFLGSLSDEKLSAYDCATIYGAAGVSYYLGRGTLKALMTGKIALPYTARSLGMATMRSFAWPVAVVRDGVNVGILSCTRDGHVVARTSLSRMYGAGLARDRWVRHLAGTGKLEHMQKALQYYQKQNKVIAVLTRELEGPLRGSVSPESLKAIQNANQRLAEDLARVGAPKLKAQLKGAGQAVPAWLDELEDVGKLSEKGLIRDGVDKAVRTFASESGEGAAHIDDVQRLLAYGDSTVDDILRSGGSVDDALRAGHPFDDVCHAMSGLQKGDILSDSLRSRHLATLILEHGADDLIAVGARPALVAEAVLNVTDDAVRMGAMGEMLATKHANELVEAISRSGKPQLAREVKTIVEGATDLGDDVIRSVGSLSVEAAETTTRVGRTAADVLPEGARVAAGAEDLSRAAIPAVVDAATSTTDDALRLFQHAAVEDLRGVLRAEDFKALMRHGPTKALLASGKADEAARLLRAAYEAQKSGEGLLGAKRAASYLMALGDDAPAVMRAPEVVRMASSGSHGNPAAIGRFFRHGVAIKEGADLTVEGCERAVQQISRWQGAGRGMRAIYFAGAAVEVGFLGYEIYRATQDYAAESKQEEMLRGELKRIGLEPSSDDPNVYEGHGVTITLESLDPTDFEASVTRAGVAAGALATTILAPSLVLGPGGLVVAGVVITAVFAVDAAWSAVEQRRHLEYLAGAPSWIHALISTETTIGQTEYETIREYDGVVMSDVVPTTWSELALTLNPITAGLAPLARGNREGMKDVARENVMQGRMYRRFAQYYDEYIPELPHKQDGPTGEIGPRTLFHPEGEFMKPEGDFEQIVRPYINLRLHSEMEGEGVDFGSTQQLVSLSEQQGGFGNWLMGLGFPSVSEYEFDDALEEAMMLEVWHVRENRHWARMDHIEKRVEEEEKRLAGIEGMSGAEKAERVQLFREALVEIYKEEIEYDPAFYYIFNVDPMEIPRRDDGKTWALHTVEERTEWAESVRSDRSAEKAGTGYNLPWANGGKDMTIGEFARQCLRPEKLESVKGRLEKNSPPMGKPLSLDQLEAMGIPSDPDAEWDVEQFRQRFTSAITPLEEVSSVFTRQMTTDEQLKAAVQGNTDAIDFYIQFAEHEGFYRDYLSHWRAISMPLPLRVSSEFVTLLRDWKREGYPKLVPTEEEFKSIQDFARNRPLRVPQIGPMPRERSVEDFFGARTRNRSEELTLSLPGAVSIPGYDPNREGTLLFSYGGYTYFNSQASVPQKQRMGFDALDPRGQMLQRMGLGSSSLPLGSYHGLDGDRLQTSPWLPSTDKEEVDRSMRQMYSQMNGKYFDSTGRAVPIISLQGRDDLVALTPSEVKTLFDDLNGDVSTVPIRIGERELPFSMPKYLPLQQYLLQSRLFIIHDPQPTQPQLPMDLSGSSFYLPIPSEN